MHRVLALGDRRENNIPVTAVFEWLGTWVAGWLGSWVSSVPGVGTLIARASLVASSPESSYAPSATSLLLKARQGPLTGVLHQEVSVHAQS
jgi:hypothetical protein